MATIKDVALSAGVSTTTVSIIINGRATEKRIPQITVDKVTHAMHLLGYQPNLSARRLRTNDARKPVIAFYWPLDYRTYMLGSFLSSLQNAIVNYKFECELVIQTYVNDQIEKSTSSIVQNNYNGVIIGAASEKDLQYLETLTPRMPVILINRDSHKYSTVGVNSNKMGLQAASLLRQKGYTEVAILKAEHSYVAAASRTSAFTFACRQLDIRTSSDWIYSGPNTIAGGSLAVESFCAQADRPRILYCESDCMAQGALYTLRKYGLLIPSDLELLSMGMQGEDTMQYLVPSVSTISMPTTKISETAITTLFHALTKGDFSPVHIELEPVIHLRESFKL